MSSACPLPSRLRPVERHEALQQLWVQGSWLFGVVPGMAAMEGRAPTLTWLQGHTLDAEPWVPPPKGGHGRCRYRCTASGKEMPSEACDTSGPGGRPYHQCSLRDCDADRDARAMGNCFRTSSHPA